MITLYDHGHWYDHGKKSFCSFSKIARNFILPEAMLCFKIASQRLAKFFILPMLIKIFYGNLSEHMKCDLIFLNNKWPHVCFQEGGL